MGLQGNNSVHVIKLQVMFDWSLEWDCSGLNSLSHWDGWEITKKTRAVL